MYALLKFTMYALLKAILKFYTYLTIFIIILFFYIKKIIKNDNS